MRNSILKYRGSVFCSWLHSIPFHAQVSKFWGKAEDLVVYKTKSIAEAKKKEIMDKHLNFLVGQTQRYSTMLAKRLQHGEAL